MNMMAHAAFRRIREKRFLAGLDQVLETAPLRGCEDGVVIFSMIGTRVLLPYLLAAKSLHRNLGRGRFAVLDDGTLTDRDRAFLRHHMDDPQILKASAIETGACPRGGCWERLLALLELRRDAYVIQLDSDTVTLGPLPEVADAIAQGRNFTLKEEAVARWMTVDDFVATPPFCDPMDPETHVQDVAEALLPRICADLPALSHYVRGCAGFAGFAPGGLDASVAMAFSREVEAIVGKDVWARWGSEQVMSNVIVANEGEPAVLPYERYLNYWNEPVPDDAALVHFIGSYRYHGGAYAGAARRAIAQLLR